jgi:hypothetical protein
MCVSEVVHIEMQTYYGKKQEVLSVSKSVVKYQVCAYESLPSMGAG